MAAPRPAGGRRPFHARRRAELNVHHRSGFRHAAPAAGGSHAHHMNIWLMLLAMLGVILVAAEVFTNALEHLGERLRISEGVTGSVFAATATAMPESKG